jgi:hypothetical protein
MRNESSKQGFPTKHSALPKLFLTVWKALTMMFHQLLIVKNY